MKFLFLDIDGVLNCEQTTERYKKYRGICPERVARLNKICEAVPDVQIVLSSTWRSLGLLEVERYMREQGYTGPSFHSATKLSNWIDERGGEIKNWLDTYRSNVEEFAKRENPPKWAPRPLERFVILDDDYEGFEGGRWSPEDLSPYHIRTYDFRTDCDGGLQDHHVELAIKLLTDGPDKE